MGHRDWLPWFSQKFWRPPAKFTHKKERTRTVREKRDPLNKWRRGSFRKKREKTCGNHRAYWYDASHTRPFGNVEHHWQPKLCRERWPTVREIARAIGRRLDWFRVPLPRGTTKPFKTHPGIARACAKFHHGKHNGIGQGLPVRSYLLPLKGRRQIGASWGRRRENRLNVL